MIYVLGLLYYGSSAQAQLLNVYCEDIHGGSWKWLPDAYQIEGEFYKVYLSTLKYEYIKAVKISQEQLFDLEQECLNNFGQDWVPHPAQNWLDNWYLFFYEKDNKTKMADTQ